MGSTARLMIKASVLVPGQTQDPDIEDRSVLLSTMAAVQHVLDDLVMAGCWDSQLSMTSPDNDCSVAARHLHDSNPTS